MEREERRRADAIDRYWDAVQRGEAPTRPRDVDEVAAAAIAHLSPRQVVGAPQAAQERVRQRIATQARVLEETMGAAPTTATVLPRIDQSPFPLLIRPTSPRPGWAVQALTVLLVVGALVGGYLVFWARHPREGRLTTIPAVVATPATPTPVEKTVVAITMPAGSFPGEVIGGLNHYTMAGNTSGRWDWTCCTGIRLNYLLSGAFTIRNDGPMQVMRAATDAWEDVPTGKEITLHAGDALVSRLEFPFDVTNSAATPVELIDAVQFEGEAADDPVPHERSGRRIWAYHDQDVNLSPVAVPPGPVTLRLRQASLPPDASATIRLPPHAFVQLAISLRVGDLAVTQRPSFEVRNLGKETVDLYLLTLESGAAESGTPAGAATP